MNVLKVLVVTLVTLGLARVSGGHEPATWGLLTPLIPVSVITGHSGLLTLGLTGVALLNLKAAAAIAYWLSVRKHKRAQGWGWKRQRGHGWGEREQSGYGWGWKGHSYDRGHGWGWKPRHRRNSDEVTTVSAQTTKVDGASIEAATTTTTAVPTAVMPAKVDFSQYDPSLDEVLQFDHLGCGMRLVCELSATESLMEDEKLILDLFGRDGSLQYAEKASRGKLSYNYAALLGQHSQNTNVCSKVYGRCPHSATEMMFAIRDVAI